MLRFLRNLRYKILFKRNFGRYIVYAFGEIILVVIGILIALQINLWNQHSQNKKQEVITLNQFNQDITNDIEQLAQLIKETEHQLNDINTIVEVLDKKDNISKFFQLQRSIHDIKTFKANLGTYDESISSGKLQLILNDNLREGIFKYYREVSQYNADDAMSKIRDEIFLPYINNNIYNTAQSIGFIFNTSAKLPELNLYSLANDKDYYGILISAKGKYVQIVNWKNYLKQAQALSKKIHEELLTNAR